MELEGQWWKGQLAGDIYHALRYKVYFISSNFVLQAYCLHLLMVTMNAHVSL